MLVLLWACDGGSPLPTDAVDLSDRYTLDDSVDHPEGLAFHPGERAFFVGSLGHGGLTRIEADGSASTIYEPAEEGWSSLGMKVDGDTLYTCAVRFPSTPEAESALWVSTLDGQTEVVPLADPPNNCNDVVVDGSIAYLTDRESNRLHAVDLQDGTASVWLEHDELTPGLIGNNGIVLVDGHLLVGQYSPARLLRIPLDDPDALTVVQWDASAFGTVPDGADGIVRDGDDLVVAANRRWVRVSSDDGWVTASTSANELEVGIAAVTVAEDRLYGLKGEVVPFVLGTPVSLPFEIFALD